MFLLYTSNSLYKTQKEDVRFIGQKNVTNCETAQDVAFKKALTSVWIKMIFMICLVRNFIFSLI